MSNGQLFRQKAGRKKKHLKGQAQGRLFNRWNFDQQNSGEPCRFPIGSLERAGATDDQVIRGPLGVNFGRELIDPGRDGYV